VVMLLLAHDFLALLTTKTRDQPPHAARRPLRSRCEPHKRQCAFAFLDAVCSILGAHLHVSWSTNCGICLHPLSSL
jgi:hypothetical protein